MIYFVKKNNIEFSDDKEGLDVEENVKQILKVLRGSGLVYEPKNATSVGGKDIYLLKPTDKFIDTFRYTYEFILFLSVLSGSINVLDEENVAGFLMNENITKIAVAYIPVIATQRPYVIQMIGNLPLYILESKRPVLIINLDKNGRISRIALGKDANSLNDLDQAFVKAIDLVSSYLLDSMKRDSEITYNLIKTLEMISINMDLVIPVARDS